MVTRKVQARTRSGAISSADAEKRTVDLVWTTGARVLRYDWDGPYWEELSLDPKHVRMGRLNNGAPLLADHSSYRIDSVLGVVESARLEGDKGTATVRFPPAGVDADADRAFAKIQSGILRNVSVGYRVHKAEKVESGDGKVPVYRMTDWEPHEISAVAVGADAGAGFRSEVEGSTNECEVITRDGPPPHTMEPKMTEEEKRAAEEKAAAERKLAEEKAAAERKLAEEAKIRAQAAQAERERISGIQAACRAVRMPERAEKLIADGTALDVARVQLLAAAADAQPEISSHPSVERGADEADKRREVQVSAILARAGVLASVIAASKARSDLKTVDPGNEFRGMSLFEMARASLERAGTRTTGMSRMELAKLALRSGMNSTSDFPILLEDVARKTLLSAYTLAADTWRRFCGVETVTDFKAAKKYRLGAFGSVVEVVPEGAAFPQVAIPDGASIAISTETEGFIIAMTRQMLINDDLGAFTSQSQQMGRAMARYIENAVYALLTANGGLGPTLADSHPFFYSGRGNINSTGSALSVAGLDADRVVLGQQKDISGVDFLDLRPATLVLPLGLGSAARLINTAVNDPTSGAVAGTPNVAVGLFRDIVDTPRLTGTRRYLFIDQAISPAFVVAFLAESGQGPVLETEMGFDVDGQRMKIRLDAKAQAFDPKAAVTNAGT